MLIESAASFRYYQITKNMSHNQKIQGNDNLAITTADKPHINLFLIRENIYQTSFRVRDSLPANGYHSDFQHHLAQITVFELIWARKDNYR